MVFRVVLVTRRVARSDKSSYCFHWGWWCRRERMAAGGSPTAGGVRERGGFLPVADISRVMRKAIPPNGKIDKDSKEAVQELVSEFIAFITSE